MEFAPAPVPAVGSANNPYVDVIQELAKLDPAKGKEARVHPLIFGVDNVDTRRAVRLLRLAGDLVEPPVTVNVRADVKDDTTTLTFWVSEKIRRPRAESVASVDSTDEDAEQTVVTEPPARRARRNTKATV